MAETNQQNQQYQNRPQKPRQSVDSNVVFVGKKPAMSYVLACVTQLNSGHKNVIIRARGRAISHAVDVAQIVKNKFMLDTEVSNVKIDTEAVKDESGQELNISSIEISLGKK